MSSPTASVKDMEALLEKISPTDAARTIEKANVTSEELDKIQSSMKDPEFRRMLAEYMTEIQSPETRKEYEDMLQNADGIPGMTKPEGKRLLKPEPWCTLEVNRQGDGSKVYVSLTCHEDVAEWSTDGITSVLSLPCLTGPLNYEHDVEALARAKGDHSKVGADVPTIEVCFSKASLHAATPAQLRLAERTAIEQADIRVAELDKMRGGGGGGGSGGKGRERDTNESSTAMVVGKGGGKRGSSSTSSLKVLEADYTFVKKNGTIVSGVGGEARSLMVSIGGGVVRPERTNKGGGGSGGGGGKKAAPPPPVKPSSPAAPAKSASVIKPRGGVASPPASSSSSPFPSPSLPLTLTPTYKVVEKASSITKDLTDSHLGLQRSAANFFTAPPIKRPANLEVRITLPGVSDPSILDAELLDSRTLGVKTTAPVTPFRVVKSGGGVEEIGEVGEVGDGVKQRSPPTLYSLSLRLPYPVLLGVEHTKVKFLREKEELKVTLSVEPPPAPTLIVNNGYTESKDGEEEGERDLTLPGNKSSSASASASASSSSPLVTVIEENVTVSGGGATATTAAAAPASVANPFVKGRIDAAPDYVPTPASPPTTSAQAAKKAAPVVPTAVVKPAPTAPTPPPSASQPHIPADAAVPLYRWRETSLLVSIIIDVAGVDEGSIKVVWEEDDQGGGGSGSRSVASLVFKEKAERGGKVWALRRLVFFGGVNPTSTRTRVTTVDTNLCWVLEKSKGGEMWGKLLLASEEVPSTSTSTSSATAADGKPSEAPTAVTSPILPPLPPSPKSQPLKSPPPPRVLFEMD